VDYRRGYAAARVTTIDRDKWIKERLEFLQSQRGSAATDEARALIDSEIDALRAQIRGSWVRRWLLGLNR
jgi:hypothetical protein